jgi:hypothetical protein
MPSPIAKTHLDQPTARRSDTATAKARLTAHSAVDDPNSSPNAPPRRSIEVRAILFW